MKFTRWLIKGEHMEKVCKIVEIGPRDGLQNIKTFVPTETKIEMIDRLVESGIRDIQLTSFVSPKAIPQMADAAEVTKESLRRHPDVHFFALVPNLRGAENAMACGLTEVSYVISVSQSHNMANVRRTPEESFQQLAQIRREFPDLKINLDAATAFGCPFEGYISYEQVERHIAQGYELGITSFGICDTIGIATPDQVADYLDKIQAKYPDATFQLHIHDTRNMGMVNSLVGLQHGVDGIQTTLGGLGGCPFAPGASGNTSTEDFVYMVNQMGYHTGVDFDKLLDAAKWLKSQVEGNYSGHHMNITKEVCTQ